MILTEEQRAALKRVVAYMDEMYAIASPYHGCTEDANILRATIDSSGTVEPAGGFDLEKARAADEALPYPLDAKEIWISRKGQMHINPPNAPSIFFTLSDLCEFRNIFHGQAAEIERLRAEISEQKGMIWKTQQVKKEQYAQIKELKADLEQSERVIEARLDVIDQQAAKIRELEDAHKRSGAKYAKIINELRSSVYANMPGLKKQWDEIMKSKDTRIQELEDALVEERVIGEGGFRAGQCEFWYIEDLPEESCMELDGPCDWAKCPRKHELCDVAYQQLAEEGKIGPDADAKPREGLYGKYRISKADGSPVDPNADYFVLRLDTDPVARRAAREYSYVTPDRDLARGLQDRLAKYDPQLKDCMNIQFFGLEKPHCWQITEERILAIENAISSCVLIERYTGQDLRQETTALRAMLTEAGQE